MTQQIYHVGRTIKPLPEDDAPLAENAKHVFEKAMHECLRTMRRNNETLNAREIHVSFICAPSGYTNSFPENPLRFPETAKDVISMFADMLTAMSDATDYEFNEDDVENMLTFLSLYLARRFDLAYTEVRKALF